ncbi:hypothetical protein [Limnohabitans sp. Jir72]|uniref:hypothetical protein n=1 Tax=Limnohabitans sp. Jir72 TaxID=1977909 RepID=UPI000D363CB6|nr:hypothetical protein [Limnohabitans sp. Jir72]PUE35015.1 hypothetical protein B9Z52_03905 [Limnohabitans sp. Jir72]
MRIFSWALVASLTAASFLSACSPEQNWREVNFDGASLKAQLPCKPERTTRSVPLGGVPTPLQVVGCESGTAMVAVMTASLQAGADAQAVLAGWQQATLGNAGVQQPLSASQQQAWRRPGFLPLASAVRVQAQGQRSDGQVVFMQAVWGAVPEGDHVRVVHAVVYDLRDPHDLAASLLDGIRP